MPWHYWIGVVLFVAALLMVAGISVGYLARVVRPRYPPRPIDRRRHDLILVPNTGKVRSGMSKQRVLILIGVTMILIVIVLAVGLPWSQQWLTKHKDAISGLSGIATTLGFAATVAALLVGVFQLRSQHETTRATAMYGAMKDARELAASITKDSAVAGVLGVSATSPEEKADLAIGRLINGYAAIYQLKEHGVVGDEEWGLVLRDLRAFMQQKRARAKWQQLRTMYSDEFVSEVEAVI